MGRVKTCFAFQFLFTLINGHSVLGDANSETLQIFDQQSLIDHASQYFPLEIESQEKHGDRIPHSATTIYPQSSSVVSSGNSVARAAQTTFSGISSDIQAIWSAKKNAVVQVMGNAKDEHGQNKLLLGTGFFFR
jgi:hypothetical protein